jgi:hypothetical protein
MQAASSLDGDVGNEAWKNGSMSIAVCWVASRGRASIRPNSSLTLVVLVLSEARRSLRAVFLTRAKKKKKVAFDIVDDLIAGLDGVSCRKLLCEGNEGLSYPTCDRSQADRVRDAKALH